MSLRTEIFEIETNERRRKKKYPMIFDQLAFQHHSSL